MDSVLFPAFALAYVILLMIAIAVVVRNGRPVPSHLVLIVLTALVYDNAIIGLGNVIGEGTVLAGLSVPRFWLHALVTPLLVIVAWHLMVRAGVRWALSRWALVGSLVLTAALVAYEIGVGAGTLELTPVREYGVLRYTDANTPEGPPLMVLVVAIVLLVAGITLMVRTRWPWLLVGTVLMIIGSGVPIPVASGAITNAFELILLTTILATLAHQERRERATLRGETVALRESDRPDAGRRRQTRAPR